MSPVLRVIYHVPSGETLWIRGNRRRCFSPFDYYYYFLPPPPPPSSLLLLWLPHQLIVYCELWRRNKRSNWATNPVKYRIIIINDKLTNRLSFPCCCSLTFSKNGKNSRTGILKLVAGSSDDDMLDRSHTRWWVCISNAN